MYVTKLYVKIWLEEADFMYLWKISLSRSNSKIILILQI